MILLALITFVYPPPVVLHWRAPIEQTAERTPALDDARLLAAIRAVEGWKGRRGPQGEFGPFQILPSVWRSHSRRSPWTAPRSEHERVARAHLAFIRRELAADGLDTNNPFWLFLAWNAGASAVIRGTAPARSWDYATRARSIYEDSP